MSTIRRIVVVAIAVFALTSVGSLHAQCVSLTTLGSAYTQNFDTLSNTAGSTTNNLTIPGWFLTEGGGGARDNEQYAVDSGGSTTGDMYSYGAAGSTERALGQLRSGTLIPVWGACFTNNTGSTITSLDVAYNGEEWRLGTAARTDQINFETSTNATDLVTGTWTGRSALNFVTPDTATTGAKNGNAAADRTALSSTISSLTIPNGATFWIRWSDVDASGADDGLAVDDFSLTPQGGVVNNSPAITAPANPITTVAQDATPFPVSLSGTDDNNVFNWSATPGAGVQAVNVTAGQGTSSATFDVTLTPGFSGTATFTATLTDNVNTPVNQAVNINVVAPPAAPTGVAAVAGTSHIQLTWNAVSGATSYVVKSSTTSGSGYAITATPATNSFDDTGVTNGVAYYYVISAVNSLGSEGAASAEVSGTAMTTPANVVATAGNAHVQLTWDAVAGATGYDVQRSTTSGSGFTSIATPATNAYDDTTAANGTTYYYVVVATNANGTSLQSSEVSATPATPGKIVISQIYGGAGCGTVGCSAYKNDYIELFNAGGTAVSVNGWSVQYSSAAGTGTWSVTPLTNVSIQPGQYYLVAEGAGANGVNNIPAPDATGSINMSATASKVAVVNSTTALSGGCPSGASILDLVGVGTTATCNEGGANAPAPSTANAIFRASSGCQDTNNNGADFAALAAGPRNTTTPVHLCGAPPANNAPAITAPANPAATVTQDAAPFTVNVSGTDDNNVFNWSAMPGTGVQSVSVTGGQGTASVTYTVTLQAGYNGTATFTATLSDNVNPAVNRAVNITVNPPAAPGVPGGLTASAGNSHVQLNWSSVPGATSYNVKRSTTSGSGYATVASPATNSYDDTSVTNGTTYYYVITAVSASVESSNSTEVSATPTLPASQVGVVISQLYGGGGSAYSNDYVELFNTTNSDVNIGGYALQYGSATGQFGSVATNIYTIPNGTTIAAHHYLSIKFGTAGSGLPTTTDIDGGATLNMSGASGKVAFTTTGTALGCGATATPCTYPDARIIDVVAYGASNNGEGGTTVNNSAVMSASAGALRKDSGCQDTNNNNNDFDVATTATGLAPRTAGTAPHTCPIPNLAPTIVAPANPIATVNENASSFTVTLSGNDDNSIYSWSATPGAGVASVSVTAGQGTNSVTYSVTLQSNYYGTATFTASLSDTVNLAATQTVNIQVNRDVLINHPPTITAPADPLTYVATNSAPINVNVTGNDDNSQYTWSATPGAGLTAAIVTAGQGTPNVTFNVTFQPGFTGMAAFTASLSDGVNPATNQVVHIGVSPNGSSVNHVVISQIYGGGGNTSATYLNDYVELYNPTGSPVDMTGWSLQYGSATNTGPSNASAPLGGIIGPGEYFLVALASGGSAGAALPAPNLSGDINMSGSNGKIALVRNFDLITGTCGTLLSDPDIVDFVGYGTANCSEGGSAAPAPANSSTALFRANGGDTDTNVNGSDFSQGAPNPRRTSPIQEIGPVVVLVDPSNNDSIAPRDANLVITFSEPVDVTSAGWYTINCTVTGNHDSATYSQSGTRSWTIVPNVNFLAGEQCTATVLKDFVRDSDTDDANPNTDYLPSNYSWTFTIASGTAPPYPSSVHLTMGNPSNAVADTNVPANYLMEKPEMALSYNRDKGEPNWVSWHLADEWIGSLPRNDTFRADPAVPSDWYRVLGSDFSNSGFDRGHMMPNADRDKETSVPINQATFLMSNMIPQAPDNNQGPWAAMENDLRTIVAGGNELYIVSGPAGSGGTGSNGFATTIDNGHVAVPASTWKVVMVLTKASGDDVARVTPATRTIAVIMPNVQGIRNNDWHQYITTVDAVEALTGYDFFSNVPDAIENAIEAGTDGTNPPGAANGSATTSEDTARAITLDAATPAGALTYTIVTPPAHGQLSGSGANQTYTPAADYFGSDSFTYKVNDGTRDSNTATVTITITDVNDNPVAVADAKTATANTPLTFPASDLTANDTAGATNESTQTLTVTQVAVTASTHGTVSLNSGSITYSPDTDYSGPASFSYTVCDNGTTNGAADPRCSSGTVSVTINTCALPTVPTIGATTNGTGTQDQACPAQPLTLTATSTGAASYQWYKDIDLLPGETGPTYQATGAATYYVTATNACGTTAKSAGYVVQNPTPHSAFVTATGTMICAGGSVMLTSDSATGIQWYKDNVAIPGANSQSYLATSAGSYTAVLNALGCQSSVSNTVVLASSGSTAPNGAITAPAAVLSGSTGNPASVADAGAGATYSWSGRGAQIASGQGSSSITFNPVFTSGTITLYVTVTTPDGCTVTSSANVTVLGGEGVATHFVVSAPATATAGAPFNVTVTAQDSNNTTAVTYTGTVHFTSSSAGTLPADYTFTQADAGVHTFSVTLNNAGTRSVTVTDTTTPAVTGTTNVNITAGAPVTIATMSGSPQSATVNTAFATALTARVADAFNNPVSGTSVTFAAPASGASGTFGGAATVTTDASGIATAPTFTANSIAGTYSVTATAGALSTSFTLTNVALPATHLSVTAPSNATAGAPFSVVVSALDANNGAVTGYTGTVQLTTNTGLVLGSHTFVPGDGGTVTFSVTINAAGNYTITGSDGSISGTSGTVTVTCPAAPTAEVITVASAVCAGSTGNTATANSTTATSYTWAITNGTITAGQGTRSVTFTAGTSGDVNLTVTPAFSANACSNTVTGTATVHINAAPTARVDTGEVTTCAGSPATIRFTLTGVAPFSITWSDGVVQTVASTRGTRVVTADRSRRYSIDSVSDSSSCATGIGTGRAIINVNTTPVIVNLTSAVTLRPGERAELSVLATGGDLRYAWYEGATGDTSNLVGEGPSLQTLPLGRSTKFWVRVTNSCGTIDSAAVEVTVSAGRRRAVGH